MEFDIHVWCVKCEGRGVLEQTAHGVNANGPWVDFTEHDCDECDGSRIEHVGIETHDSLADAQADYPDGFVFDLSENDGLPLPEGTVVGKMIIATVAKQLLAQRPNWADGS